VGLDLPGGCARVIQPPRSVIYVNAAASTESRAKAPGRQLTSARSRTGPTDPRPTRAPIKSGGAGGQNSGAEGDFR
jgi:hypothetical protein